MSRRGEASVDYIDTMSSGDSVNAKTSTQTPKTKEVNNNEVDELSKELSKMGCIVDAVKRPPNICVEDIVYESDSEKTKTHEADEDAYSDEFEDDEEDPDEKPKDSASLLSSLKLTKSQSSIASLKAPSISARSRTTDMGLVEKLVRSDSCLEWRCGVPGCLYHRGPAEFVGQRTHSTCRYEPSISCQSKRRMNMSFTNERMREIERHNNILLTKIISARNSRKQTSIPPREQPPTRRLPTSAAVSRKNHQRQIDHDNLILLKKIQRAKSSSYNGAGVRRR